jgi:hypothetical protein
MPVYLGSKPTEPGANLNADFQNAAPHVPGTQFGPDGGAQMPAVEAPEAAQNTGPNMAP